MLPSAGKCGLAAAHFRDTSIISGTYLSQNATTGNKANAHNKWRRLCAETNPWYVRWGSDKEILRCSKRPRELFGAFLTRQSSDGRSSHRLWQHHLDLSQGLVSFQVKHALTCAGCIPFPDPGSTLDSCPYLVLHENSPHSTLLKQAASGLPCSLRAPGALHV